MDEIGMQPVTIFNEHKSQRQGDGPNLHLGEQVVEVVDRIAYGLGDVLGWPTGTDLTMSRPAKRAAPLSTPATLHCFVGWTLFATGRASVSHVWML